MVLPWMKERDKLVIYRIGRTGLRIFVAVTSLAGKCHIIKRGFAISSHWSNMLY